MPAKYDKVITLILPYQFHQENSLVVSHANNIKDANGIANSEDPDQTALFAKTYLSEKNLGSLWYTAGESAETNGIPHKDSQPRLSKNTNRVTKWLEKLSLSCTMYTQKKKYFLMV